MSTVRIGVIGLGNIGSFHANYLTSGKIDGCRLSAVCDIDESRLKPYSAAKFIDSAQMISSRIVDAVIIATPHYSHTTIGIDALKAGLHVLVEKPLSVHKVDCQRLLKAHRSKKQVFAMMYNQRTNTKFIKIKELISSNALGNILRVNWTITNWFRTDAYYRSSSWRATWKGEGGGVLINQASHNLDIFQLLFGMPVSIYASCNLGRCHKIETEDDVTMLLKYRNGMNAVLCASTCEAPGMNRLEIQGDNGLLLLENDDILFFRNETSSAEHIKHSKEHYAPPQYWKAVISTPKQPASEHQMITQNFIDTINGKASLLVPAQEGIKTVEITNAALLSSFKKQEIVLPLDGKEYTGFLKKMISRSYLRKTQASSAYRGDLSRWFNKK